MNRTLNKLLEICCRSIGSTLIVAVIVSCSKFGIDPYCESKKKIIEKEEVRSYLHSWINKNIIENPDIERQFEMYASLESYKLYAKIPFDWNLLGLKYGKTILLYGENLRTIEVVYFGQGFRNGFLVSLREDKQIPSKWIGKKDICYQFEEYAIYDAISKK